MARSLRFCYIQVNTLDFRVMRVLLHYDPCKLLRSNQIRPRQYKQIESFKRYERGGSASPTSV